MKKLVIGTFVCLLSLWALVACQPEEVSPLTEEVALEEESFIVTSADEVDALLMAKYGSDNFSLEDKLNFLSDYYAQQFYDKLEAAGRGESATNYLAIAQVFDGTAYFTDVVTGDGSSSIEAYEFELRNDQLAFAGCNANVYLNMANIGGSIFNVQDLVCIGEEISLWARARWSPTSTRPNGVTTTAYIKCDK
ncbi:MAG TPA: hypothetical protein DCE41_29820 [Cytophagales bacterium]|nr:hypothetical protein [Cytophagales bacterium]HAA19180.1 hypothetical protein [Cytophagales bacterium]HAP58869.1 hypothetical protein [Cytophagales bacterium]